MTTPFDISLSIGQLSWSWRWRVVDSAGVHKGTLSPTRAGAISHDVSSTIPRKVDGITLINDDVTLFDTASDRVWLEAIADGIAYPLGRFVAVDAITETKSSGTIMNVTLVDEMLFVDQPIVHGFTPRSWPRPAPATDFGWESVPAAVRRLLASLPISESRIDDLPHRAVGSWKSGTSRAQIWRDLATDGGYFPPWFDNTGTPRMIVAFNPNDITARFDWDAEPRIVRNTITMQYPISDIPNRYIVVSNDTASDAATAPVLGIADVPASAPHSIAQRGGLVVPHIVERQVRNVTEATRAARVLAAMMPGQTMKCTTMIDPRHDAFDVIKYNGQLWLEVGWSIELGSDGVMSHTLITIWNAES